RRDRGRARGRGARVPGRRADRARALGSPDRGAYELGGRLGWAKTYHAEHLALARRAERLVGVVPLETICALQATHVETTRGAGCPGPSRSCLDVV
ncbi:MAG: hypothetical protein NZL88_04055, partial [Gaiellaceae bacterium]|nr:hypothetical protein [Gaiellaceae bacterium]